VFPLFPSPAGSTEERAGGNAEGSWRNDAEDWTQRLDWTVLVLVTGSTTPQRYRPLAAVVAVAVHYLIAVHGEERL